MEGCLHSLIWFALLAIQLSSVSWDYANNPAWWGIRTLKISSLPVARSISGGWSSTYWPNKNGGVAHRWVYGADTPTFYYQLYNLQQLRKMNRDQLRALSPAEKYDILNNRLDYPTVRSEWRRTSPSQPKWYGLCHGWAPATILYAQPNPVTLRGSNGIPVPFGTADIEALLSYFLALYGSMNMKMLGHRCQSPLPCYGDLNAGSFFVLLGNEIGLKGNMFVLDIDPTMQVWNQPVSGYSCRMQNGAGRGQVQATCTITYISETVPTWNPHPPRYGSESYKMTLDVNAAGDIVGGQFNVGGGFRTPDFAWNLRSPMRFTGYLSRLQEIYIASINSRPYVEAEPRVPSTPAGAPMVTPATPTVSWSLSPLSYGYPVALSYNGLGGLMGGNAGMANPLGGNFGGLYGGAAGMGRPMVSWAEVDPDFGPPVHQLSPQSDEPLYSPEDEAECSPLLEVRPDCSLGPRTGKGGRCSKTVEYLRPASQEPPMCAIWKLFCPLGFHSVNISFTEFHLTPQKTEVKVYEGMDGPLFTSASGIGLDAFGLQEPIVVPAASARVVLESLAWVNGTGPERLTFQLHCLV